MTFKGMLILGLVNHFKVFIMQRSLIGIFIVAVIGFASSTQARNLNEATDELCVKIKTCGQEQLKSQGIPPEMQQMMSGMFDTMCKSMTEPYLVSTKDAGLEKMAIACVDSFVTKSCKAIMEGAGGSTPECDEFEAATKEAYPDGLPEQ